MPHKRLQQSRLNSLIDLHAYCYNDHTDPKSRKLCSKYVEIEVESIEEGINEGEEDELMHRKPYKKHRYWQVQEYIEFKAARTIQRMVRGWLVRARLADQTLAAIVIQRNWRAFYYRNRFYQKVEDILQKRTEEHYTKSATKIQALFRGWWSRQNIHDHTRLLRLELNAGEDLLHCVAFKLHHLIRTHQIPGIYSLKNTTALSKVEQLLASMTFKQCNDRARAVHRRRLQEIENSKRLFQKSRFGTELPYAGPNIYNLCEPKCVALYSSVDADRKMIKILNMYEKATKEDPRLRKIRQKQFDKMKLPHMCMPPPTTFCGDVVRSMKKWKIVTESNYTINPNIFKTPENVENFLKDVQSKWSILHGLCPCQKDEIQKLREQESDIKRKFVP